eukprot:scaffold219836_cov33-Prasinocladus_malaysianus.AAC.1
MAAGYQNGTTSQKADGAASQHRGLEDNKQDSENSDGGVNSAAEAGEGQAAKIASYAEDQVRCLVHKSTQLKGCHIKAD